MPLSTANPTDPQTPDVLNQMPVVNPDGTPGTIPPEDWPKAQALNYRKAYFATSPEGKLGILHPDDVPKATAQGFQLGQPTKPVEQGSDEWYASKLPQPVVSALGWFQRKINDPLNRMAAKGAQVGHDIAQKPVEAYTTMSHAGDWLNATMPSPYGPKPPVSITPHEQAEQEHPVAMGVAGGVGSAVGGTVADPRSWPFFLAGGEAVEPAFQKLMSAGFAAQQGAGTAESIKYLHDNWDQMTPEQRAEYATQAGLQGTFAALSAKGAAEGAGEPLKEGAQAAGEQLVQTKNAIAQSRPVQAAQTAIQGAKAAWNPEKYLSPEQAATKAFRPRNSKSNWNQEISSALPDMRRAADQQGLDLDNMTLSDALNTAGAAKKDVWAEYEQNHLDPASPVQVSTQPVADAMRSKVSDRMNEQNPGMAKKIDRLASTYDNRVLTVGDLQDRVSQLNNELRSIEAKYVTDKRAAKLSPSNAYKFAERDTLRGLLDDTLEQTGGEGGADLRKRWGALNSVEDAISRRIPVAERANPVSLTKIFEMLQGPGRIVRGVFGGGPADVAMGLFNTKAMMNAEKMNNPDWLTQQAFLKTVARPGWNPRTVHDAEYVPTPTQPNLPTPPSANAPLQRPLGFLPRGVYQQPGGFEPNQPALPAYRGIPLGPSTVEGSAANAPKPAVRVPLEPNEPQGPALSRPGAGQPEQLPARVSGRPSSSNQPQRAPQGKAGGTYGNQTQVLTSAADLPGKYKVVEADDLVPSHNAGTFAQNPNYPEGVQERTYHSSKEAQARIIQQAQNYDPRYTVNTNPDAVNGPPIVTKDGIVLGGNSRTMSTQRLYAAGRGDVYKNALMNQAQSFGLDRNAIAGMKKPILVREVTATGGVEGMRKLGADLNKNMTGALSVQEKAVSAGRSISPETLETIGDLHGNLGEDASLRDVLSKAGHHVLNLLIRDGAVTERERPQLVDTATGGLSEEGKTFVERALLGSVIDDPDLMQRTPKSVLNKVGNSLADVAKLGAREDEYNILPLVREAIADHAEMAEKGLNVATYLDQPAMFGKPRSEAVEALIRTLGKKPTQAREAFRQFAQDAAFSQPGQGTLALMETPSAAKSFNDAFGSHLSDEQLLDALRDSMMTEPGKADPEAAAARQTQAVDQAKDAVRSGRIQEALGLRDQARRPELEPAELQDKDTKDMHQVNGEYTPARQGLHRNLVAQTGIGNSPQKENPTFVLLGGGAASGKSHLARAASLKYPDAVRIDPDAFKAGLPEYESLQKSDPLGASARVHEESSDISKQALDKAFDNRHDIILDAVSGKPEKTAKMLDWFRNAGYRIEAHFADRPVNEALGGMVSRFERNGRWVPPDVLTEGHAGAARTFPHIAPTVDESSLSTAKPGGGHQLVYENGNVYNQDAYNEYRAKGGQYGRSRHHSGVSEETRGNGETEPQASR